MGYRTKYISNTDFKMHLPIITEASTTIRYAQKAVFLSGTSKTRNLISQQTSLSWSSDVLVSGETTVNMLDDYLLTLTRDMRWKIPCVYAPSVHFLSQILKVQHSNWLHVDFHHKGLLRKTLKYCSRLFDLEKLDWTKAARSFHLPKWGSLWQLEERWRGKYYNTDDC